MPSKKALTLVVAVLIVASGFLTAAAPAFAAIKEEILHSFGSNSHDGTESSAGLIFDALGRLYGTTESGGIYDYGTVFQLTRGTDRKWTRTVLHAFHGGKQGANPEAGLIFDAAGHLYGTTSNGGAYGAGTVFELVPGAHGTWSERVIHSLNGLDGSAPTAGLAFDSAGNLYGTASRGGPYGGGTVFQLTPGANGRWSRTVLHRFHVRVGNDGSFPYAGLVIDSSGNLYGTTWGGGLYTVCGGGIGCGTVFEVTLGADGKWTEKVLYRFCSVSGCADGDNPYGGTLIFDAVGNLYGTTANSGVCSSYCGTVYQLMPAANGTWTETVLHSFSTDGEDGVSPLGAVVFDAAGNLYGTTSYGGDHQHTCKYGDCGIVFQLSPGADGAWSERLLHTFQNNGRDGYTPEAGVIVDQGGSLYSTTEHGGASGSGCGDEGCGTVFEITP